MMKTATLEQVTVAPVVTEVPETATIRLLHVEDNPADALLMQEYIRAVLPTVDFDTAERLAEVTAERVAEADCALLDLSLPDASGLEGVVRLRQLSEHLPIIVLTGFDDMQLGLSAVRDGADDYLLKNHVDGYTLERAVQYAIERRRLMLQLAQSAAEAFFATTSMIDADSATEAMLERVLKEEAARASHAALGTHEVSVRIDRSSSEFVLQCRSCPWESTNESDGPFGVHSWASRSLELALLEHIDFQRTEADVEDAAAAAEAAAQAKNVSALNRRSIFRPRGWIA